LPEPLRARYYINNYLFSNRTLPVFVAKKAKLLDQLVMCDARDNQGDVRTERWKAYRRIPVRTAIILTGRGKKLAP
jgi:hypothetical protein